MPLGPDPALVERFRRSLGALTEIEAEDYRLGVAVSGGPDSVALLLLAAAALPGRVEAATIDHRFRAEAAGEARTVEALCARLHVPHRTMTLEWAPPPANRQALARHARYEALGQWALERELSQVATAHHLDDQAETVLMRLHRGAAVGGLAGIRPTRLLTDRGDRRVLLVRPLLNWRRDELRAIVADAGVTAIDDPANRDPAHDRTRARQFLEQSPDWPDRSRLAASAAALGEADRALAWMAAWLQRERARRDGDAWTLDLAELPPELRRRLVLDQLLTMTTGRAPPRGDRLTRALTLLAAGRVATLVGIVIRPDGDLWRFEPAPARRT